MGKTILDAKFVILNQCFVSNWNKRRIIEIQYEWTIKLKPTDLYQQVASNCHSKVWILLCPKCQKRVKSILVDFRIICLLICPRPAIPVTLTAFTWCHAFAHIFAIDTLCYRDYSWHFSKIWIGQFLKDNKISCCECFHRCKWFCLYYFLHFILAFYYKHKILAICRIKLAENHRF